MTPCLLTLSRGLCLRVSVTAAPQAGRAKGPLSWSLRPVAAGRIGPAGAARVRAHTQRRRITY